MKNRLAVISTFLLFGAIVVLIGYAVISIVLKPQNPLSNADIPQSTIDWFKGLIDGGSDIGGILGPDERDSSDWERYEDIDSMLRVEDEYFVIYYSTNDSVVERTKALICQRYAHEAVPIGELFMKEYPYPSKLNGRKLPIYLANTVGNYRSICKQLGHGDPGTGSIGLYCFQFGGGGVYTDGVIISPKAWEHPDITIKESSDDVEFKKTLWHEMNHFMYFSNWNYYQTSTPNLWFTEGLAEYFSTNYERLREVGNYKKLNLANDFRGGGNTEYWAGLSAYLCLETNFGKAKVSDMVANSYTHSVSESVTMTIPNYSISTWNEQWHTYMDNKEYRKYLK